MRPRGRGAQPLVFRPLLQPKVWGGERLRQRYPDCPSDTAAPVGEAWLLSDLPGGTTLAPAGHGRELPIRRLAERAGPSLLGRLHDRILREGFPVVLKVIDARQRLSVQVHPDDERARSLVDEPRGKEEAWYVLEADPGARLYLGLREAEEPFTAVRGLAASARCEDRLHAEAALPGAFYPVPAGLLHAIGEGVVLLEVAQGSDTTFRVHDWGRVGLTGAPRAVHLDAAVAAASGRLWRRPPARLPTVSDDGGSVELLGRSPSFQIERVTLRGQLELELPEDCFSLLVPVAGPVTLAGPGGRRLKLPPLHATLVPAAWPTAALAPGGAAEAVVLRVTVPDEACAGWRGLPESELHKAQFQPDHEPRGGSSRMESRFFAVVLAGGAGTRFWPRSRRKDPKQTVPFLGGASLLQRTVARLRPAVRPEDFLIVTAEEQLELMRAQLPDLPDEAFVAEPVARNTAPAVGLAALLLARRAPERPMLVLPSDHFIQDETTWRAVMLDGVLAAAEPGRTVLFGIKPTSPHTGYGYVELGAQAGAVRGRPYFDVVSFREKPNLETAALYVERGTFLWNSGCFAWRPDTFLELCARHAPDVSAALRQLDEALSDGAASTRPPRARPAARRRGAARPAATAWSQALARAYPAAPSVSVDYAILEKCAGVVGLPIDVGWNDVGSWPSLFEVLPRDGAGNVVPGGDALLVDCKDSLFWGEDCLVAAVGVRDLVVIQSRGVVMVCPRSEAQRVRELVARLDREGKTKHL